MAGRGLDTHIDFDDYWANGSGELAETAQELGYEGVKYRDKVSDFVEYNLSPSLIKRSKHLKYTKQKDRMAKLKESSERIKAKKATEVIPKKIFGDNSPSTPPDEILHTSSRPYKGGKPDKDSWFGNRDWYNEYVNILDDGTPVHEFGDNISSIKPPKNTRTLDIDFVKPENLSKEATEFMSSVAKKVQPENKELFKGLQNKDPEAIDEFLCMWADGDGLAETAREQGYGIVKLGNEHFVLKEVIDASEINKTPVKNPKTGKLESSRLEKLKESSERVKAKTTSAFDKMAEESSEELDEVLDIWEGNADDKAGFIKWVKSDAPYDKKKYKVTAAWREAITKLRKHIKD